MDFKVAGTRQGITAFQMDIKISGISREIFAGALGQARRGRMFLLDKMEATLQASRPELSEFAPRLLSITVPEDKIRDVIGSGGKTIQALHKEYSCKIDVQDDGTVTVASNDLVTAEKCLDAIRQPTTSPVIGTEYGARSSGSRPAPASSRSSRASTVSSTSPSWLLAVSARRPTSSRWATRSSSRSSPSTR